MRDLDYIALGLVLNIIYRVSVALTYGKDGSVGLEIGDDGRGFDPALVPPGHLGVSIMRERAQEAGALFHLDSSPGAGTRIAVELGSRKGPAS